MLWKSNVKAVKVMDELPEVPQFPISLYHDMSIDHLQDLLQCTLQTLVKRDSNTARMHCNNTSRIGRWHSKLTIPPHMMTPSSVNANHNSMFVRTWPCHRLFALRVCLLIPRHSTPPPPPSPSCTKFR